MLMDDIFNSCTHEKVAQAAVACIGGVFADRVRHVAAVRGLTPGARVCVKSALLHVGNTSMRVFHKMFDETTGELVATEDQLGVLLDMDARRPTPLSDEMRARAKAMLAPSA